MSEEKSRWWNSKELRSSLPAIVIIIAFFVLVVFYKHGRDNLAPDDDYSLNVHTEVFGVALGVLITIYVIDTLNHRRDERRRRQELIDRLLREVRSPEGIIARHAYFEIKEGRLMYNEDSILRGAFLRQSRPGKVDLEKSNLDGANMIQSDFRGSRFFNASLEGAKMMEAKLDDTNFVFANLKNADLQGAYLTNANFAGADLRGANLRDVVLDNANFAMIGGSIERIDTPERLSNCTILPNGCPWKPETNMEHFTNPDHPDFWRSCAPESPAHRDHPQLLS